MQTFCTVNYNLYANKKVAKITQENEVKNAQLVSTKLSRLAPINTKQMKKD